MQLSAMEAEGAELESGEEAPDAQTARNEMKQLLLYAIESLPESEHAVYELRDLEEVGGEETAARLGLSLAGNEVAPSSGAGESSYFFGCGAGKPSTKGSCQIVASFW